MNHDLIRREIRGARQSPRRDASIASIMEFENLSSVKASRRRRTPVWIGASTCSFTFSTPASASTTGAVAEGAAARLASSSTVTLLTGANVSATRHAKMRREKLSTTAWR
jgi:hypothetical protein